MVPALSEVSENCRVVTGTVARGASSRVTWYCVAVVASASVHV